MALNRATFEPDCDPAGENALDGTPVEVAFWLAYQIYLAFSGSTDAAETSL